MIKKKFRLKRKYALCIFSIILIVFLSILIISIYNIVKWKIDSNNTDNQITQVQKIIDVNEINDNDNTEIIESYEEDKSNPYWDYIKMNLIDIDFKSLRNINNQTKAWLQVNGTNINYPVVQTDNNKYYLTHTFDKSYNKAGWVFLDYREKLDGTDRNTIIYAHGRLDKVMFGSLKNILTSGWLENKNNYVVKLSTECENTLWQVFSVYNIPTTNDYIRTTFSSDNDFKEFTNMLIKRSAHNFDTVVNETDKILTLSTCYNNANKVVLHAKLIKKEVR